MLRGQLHRSIANGGVRSLTLEARAYAVARMVAVAGIAVLPQLTFALGEPCQSDIGEVAVSSLSDGTYTQRCTPVCLVADVQSIKAETAPQDMAPTEASGQVRKVWNETVASASTFSVWVRYRTSPDRRLRASVSVEGRPDNPTGFVPVSTAFRWGLLAAPDGQPLTLDLPAGPARLTVSASSSDMDNIACVYLAGARDPAPRVRSAIEVDRVWTGTRAAFDAVSRGNFVFAGYYDAERWLTVAKIDMATRKVTRARLPSRFSGWDSHNDVHLALDPAGLLHVAANMHVSPLVYFRSKQPLSLDGFTPASMTGANENRVTYPTFLAGFKHRMFFLFRDGVSGNGTWHINGWDGQRWERINPKPLFADRDERGPVSAYPSEFAVAPDGAIHTALMWRRPGDVAYNFRITHAATNDFQTWRTASGRTLTSPLGVDDGDIVDDPGPNSGLLNTHHLSIAPDGRPVVSYTKYTPDGRNGAYLRFFETNRWVERLLGSSPQRIEIRGAGSLPRAPGMRAVNFEQSGAPQAMFAFPGAPGAYFASLDPKTLEPTSPPRLGQDETAVARDLAGYRGDLLDRAVMTAPVREEEPQQRSVLIWSAQQAFGDQPRRCTPQAPNACQPAPDILRLVTPK